MKRRVFNVAAVISLLLCVGTSALWVWSYWYANSVGGYSPAAMRQVGMVTNCGQLLLVMHSYPAPPQRRLSWGMRQQRANRQITRVSEWIGSTGWVREFGGFGMGSHTTISGMVRRVVMIPLWFIVVLLMPLPIVAVRRWRRHGPGLCVKCGYDLRASPDRCPECGMEVKQLAG